MSKKLSNWSAPGDKPPSVGVWQTRDREGMIAFNQWDGYGYGPSSESAEDAYKSRNMYRFDGITRSFRGLVNKPKGMK